MIGIVGQLRLSVRALFKSPGFALTTSGILALGLGLTMFMFGAVNGYVLRPLPFDGAERLVHLEMARPAEGRDSIEVSLHDYLDLRERQTSVESLAAFYSGTVNLSGDEGPERFDGAFMSANAFDALGVRPALGRGFVEGDDQPGAPTAVVLGHRLWQYRYGGDPLVVGRSIRANAMPATVVGVMPAGFRFPHNEDVWMSFALDTANLQRGEGQSLEVFGRLRSGIELGQAREEFRTLAAHLAEEHPDTNAGLTSVLKPYAEEFVGSGARQTVFTMFATVVLVLLVACANVANLILARNLARRRELAIRSALGAGRARVVALVLAECLVISLLGGVLGFVLADAAGAYTMDMIRQVETFAPPYWVDMRPDWRAVTFAAGAAVFAAIVAGLLPALRASRIDVIDDLRLGGRTLASRGLGRLTRAFVVAQVAFSCVVLVCTGLMARSVVELDRRELGAETRGVLTGRLGLFEAAYPEAEDRVRLFARLTERLEALPGVESATVSTSLPGTFVGATYVVPEGLEIVEGSEHPWAHHVVSGAEYFEAFGIPLLEGRAFDAGDRAGGQPVVVVNERFARRYWPDGGAVGRRVGLGRHGDDATEWHSVVGVVPDVIQDEVDEPLRPTVYLPLAQAAPRFASLAVRTSGDPLLLAEPVRRVVRALDPDLPVYWLRTLDDWLELGRFPTRFIAALFGVFGIVALLLGGVGLYAVLSQSVARRTREIGVRRALGALDPEVVRMVLRGAAGEISLGLALGLALAAGFARFLSAELIGVDAFDPATFGAVAAVLAGAGLVAALQPARRAVCVDPLVALRSE